jgi:diguanylate cyclase (GGDEF)-like protein
LGYAGFNKRVWAVVREGSAAAPGNRVEATSKHVNAREGMMRDGITWGAIAFALATSVTAILSTPAESRFAAGALWVLGCVVPTVIGAMLYRQLRLARSAERDAMQTIAARSRTVDRLLDFSQTIQGAGKADQILDSLSHYLRTEIGLSSIAIMSHDSESIPATGLRCLYPAPSSGELCSIAEMDTAMCPCLRQNLPRVFKPDASPVRCSIDAALHLPSDQAAFCIPFTVGRKTQFMAHMLLPVGQSWTEERRQLAQTYVNAASSSLITLHHISEAEKQSATDPLTGLFNRRSMDQLLQREIALAERHGLPMSLVMIDLDKFKEINDAHGHAAGDHMLRAFADCVRITLRKTDLAFRYGGDEFVIALTQTTAEQARAVVQKLKQAFGSVDFSDAIAHLDRQPTLSIGVAERNPRENLVTLEGLLAASDSALYDAKKSDRDCIKIYSSSVAA